MTALEIIALKIDAYAGAAAGIGSVAEPWQSLPALLLPMFGIPLFLSSIRRDGSGPATEDVVKVSPGASPGG